MFGCASLQELRGHLVELERGNFLKPTDTEGVWEFNMVERDIVYEVIPHYQRRRLHAKLAQELERSLEEHHVATLTTIAYHWNQVCGWAKCPSDSACAPCTFLCQQNVLLACC